MICWGELMAVHAYVLFKVSSGSERDVCKKVADFDEVLVAGIIYGEYDVIAKVSVPDLQALEEFLSVKIRKVSSVLVTSTMIIAREYKGKTQRNKK
ncbi:MAG: Lrp/AsnC family transcriptional regulator [Candidatus Bathyarchaeia archaeon]